MEITINKTNYEFKYYPEYSGMDLYKDGKLVDSFGVSESQYESFTITEFVQVIEKYLNSKGLDLY